MAYTKKYLIDKSMEAIQQNNLLFVDEIFRHVGFSQRVFYNKKLQEVQTIKEALEQNRINTKFDLRQKWYTSENATLQIALYKLICSDDEADRLNNSRQRIDVTHEPLGKITGITFDSEP